MKKITLLLALLMVTCGLFADGSSEDYLLSPKNTATTNKQFGSSSDTYERGGWYFIGVKGYARQAGVGLRVPSEKYPECTLSYDFPEEQSETIVSLSVTCSTASSTAAEAEHTLNVALAGTDVTCTETFITGTAGGSVTLSFTFETPQAATGLRFSNSGEKIFEVTRVTWTSQLPPIEVTYSAVDKVNVNENILVSMNDVTGGTGTYSRVTITFNGQTTVFDSPEWPFSTTFLAPTLSGEYPLEIRVTDSSGVEAVVTQTIMVYPYAYPVDLKATNITKNGFDLSWKLSTGVTPVKYEISVVEEPSRVIHEVVVAPEWQKNEDGTWQSAVGFDLSPWTDGKATYSTIAQTSTYKDALGFRCSNTAAWANKPNLGGMFILGPLPADEQMLFFKVTADTPPHYFTLFVTIDNPKVTYTVASTAQQLNYSVPNLKPGRTYSARIMVYYENAFEEDSAFVTRTSDPFVVTTEAIPAFEKVQVYSRFSMLELTWPANEQVTSGEMRVFAKRLVAHDLPAGVYLSRILLTSSAEAGSTQKAIVLTNLSNRPVHLRGQYVLQATKRDTGTTRKWDFSETSDAEISKYPYVIPAGGELIFAHDSYRPFDCRDGVKITSKSALNFTESWDIALWLNDTEQNALTPVDNAVLALTEDSRTETKSTLVNVDLANLDVLYTPWMNIEETVLLDTIRFERGATNMQMLTYSNYLTHLENTRSILARCVTQMDESNSSALEVVLWEEPTRPGFVFRVR